ncbi:MAG: PD-(D/E)XK nuclease family protein, partial [Oscillospiraceae bacterium]|nr:PD-(D/E)XK nuclease family protein [Oscillospiraceae bacterium]
MLTIINTPLNCGRVRTLEVPNPPLLVIVPEQYSHEAERELAESLGDGASLIAEVLSFTRLATRVFTECGGLNLPAPDKPAKLLLMRLAFKTVAERLHVYGARSARPEMLATLLQLREELLQCKITPDALLAIPAFNGSALFSSKIRDLALICSAYDAELAHRYDDPRDRLTRLAALIGYSAVGDHGVIRFEGFADFTKQQLDVIAELMRKGSELEFVLHTEQLAATDFDDDILALPRETSRMLERIAVSYGVEVNHLTLTGATAAEPERTLYTASDAAAECELAAALITRWIEDDGTLSPSDIAVVAPNFSGRYEAVCTAVFARRRIPYYLSRRDDILQRAIMTLITQAFAILSGGWRYDQVFTYVKTGLSGAESIDELENYVLMWNIRGVRQWSEEFTMNPNGYSASEPDAELLERVESARRQVAEPLLRLRERGKSADTAAQQCAALYAFMEELQLAEKLALKSELLAMSGEEKLAAEYTQLWDVIAAALDVAYDVLGDIPMDQDEFGSLFTLLLGQYDLGTIPLALNRVRIGGTETIRETPVRRLIVLGASETAMPASEQAPSLLSADDRKLLAHAGVEIAGDFESNMHREYYLIGRVLSKPSESLTVVHRSDDRISWLAKAYLPPDAEPELYAPLTPYVRSRDFGLSLSPESVTLLYGENPVLTPTKVEAFQTCKFSYLMQYGLKLKARKTAEINAPEFGTIVHYVLENVTREVLALGGFTNVEPPTVRELAETYVNRYADE